MRPFAIAAVLLVSGTVFAAAVSPSGDGAVSKTEEQRYLIKAEDDGFSPFLVTLPWDGYQWQVEVDPMNTALPQTGDGVGIAMFAMSASGAGIALLGRRKRC